MKEGQWRQAQAGCKITTLLAELFSSFFLKKVIPMLSSKGDMKIKGKRISVFILPLQGYMQQTVLQENLSYVLYSVISLCFINKEQFMWLFFI